MVAVFHRTLRRRHWLRWSGPGPYAFSFIMKSVPVDPSAIIAPTARIHPDASIGPRTRVGEFCIIESDVDVGADCLFEPYVFIKRWTTLGDRNEISAGTVLGTDPLDKNFTGERSYLRIGSGNKIREHYTISRGTRPESVTTIGDGNYIMTSGHIAHNCTIGNNTVIASCALVAGYVEVEDQAFISGGVVIHQFSKIGRLAMIGGNTRVNLDVPPFFLYSGFNVEARGLNVIGLKRAGFTFAQVARLKKAYQVLYRSGLLLTAALTKIEQELADENTLHLVSFIRRSERGICRE
jgi:UDP-N-acetylglucosamine acyltransferase